MEEYRHNFKEIEKGRGPSPLNLMECDKFKGVTAGLVGGVCFRFWLFGRLRLYRIL
jgi:hypothetical protein